MSGAIAAVAAAMDPSVSPCEDFYRYACGGWLDANTIPDDKPFNSRLVALDDRTHDIVRELLEDASQRPGDDARRKMIGDFYAACMDQAGIDAAGAAPLRPALDEIAAVSDLRSAHEVAARLLAYGARAFFDYELEPDYRAPQTNLITLRQGGLGLPGRDYYLQDDPQSQALRDQYTRHVAAMLELVGDRPEDADARAARVVALETALARVSLPLERLREVEDTYHKMTIEELRRLTPAIDWRRVFAAAGNARVAHVNVATPEFFRGVNDALARTDVDTLRAYLRWHLIRGAAPHLAGPIEAQEFAWTAVITGQRALAPRWRRCVQRTVAALPEAVGPDYVARAFDGDGKRVATDMLVAIEQAFERGLDALGWMDDVTRVRARNKAAAVRNMIGFPESWRDYSPVTVDRGRYFESLVSAQRFEVARQMAKADRPVDPHEWFIPVSVLNAYTNPLGLEMVFPAAILQPPLFSPELPMAVNFGAIGSMMGHELTHHFDDQGRKFNEQGALDGWWTPAARTGFETAARCVVEQFDAYEVAPGLRVRGQQTLGENIADLGGLKLAHAAYARWARARPEPSPIPGLTSEQLFFVAYAQNYCGAETPAMAKILALADVHAPRQFRVRGPLANSPAFWAAFSCREGTPMHRARACSVW